MCCDVSNFEKPLDITSIWVLLHGSLMWPLYLSTPPTDNMLNEWYLVSQLYPYCLSQDSAHSKRPTSICWMNAWMRKHLYSNFKYSQNFNVWRKRVVHGEGLQIRRKPPSNLFTLRSTGPRRVSGTRTVNLFEWIEWNGKRTSAQISEESEVIPEKWAILFV